MDTKKAQRARLHTLTRQQQEVVIGSLLGDGYLVGTTRGFAFRVNHGMKQRKYVDWKYQILEPLTNSSPKYYQRSYYFRTVSHPYFSMLRKMFYRGRKKILPKNIKRYMSARVLSIWLMDDGSKEKRQLRLNTQSFSLNENKCLMRILKASFGITVTLNRDKKKFRLRVSAASMPRVRQFVVPHIISSMRYKLSP